MGNFTPKSIFNVTNEDGSTSKAEEWDIGDVGSGTYTIGPIVKTLIILTILFPLASPILFLLSFYKSNGFPLMINIVGFVLGSYFLIDMHNYWVGSALFGIVGAFLDNPNGFFGIAVLVNIISTTLHLVFYITSALFKGYKTNKDYMITKDGAEMTLMIVVFFGTIAYLCGDMYIKNHGPWME